MPNLPFFIPYIKGDPWLQGGVVLISRKSSSRENNSGIIWYHLMETSPGWPRHDLANIKKLVNHVRLFGNNITKARTLEQRALESETQSVFLLIHTVMFFFFIYLWVLSTSDKQAINKIFQGML